MANNLIIEVFGADGKRKKKTVFKERQLKKDHKNRRCHAFCSYCYDEATTAPKG